MRNYFKIQCKGKADGYDLDDGEKFILDKLYETHRDVERLNAFAHETMGEIVALENKMISYALKTSIFVLGIIVLGIAIGKIFGKTL